MPFELPLFPLNVVLLPGMPLPLHIFEPRYRLMIKRCLEGDRTFGVALLTEGEEGQSGTTPALVGTVARITESTPFPDGRMNIQTTGLRRFRIIAAREEDDYLIGTVEWLDDVKGEPSVPLWAGKLRRILVRYLKILAQNTRLSGMDVAGIDIPLDPEELSMMVGALPAFSKDQQQELIEMTSTAARLSYEYSLLRRAEIVQLAFARRQAEGIPASPFDETLGPAAPYVSLN